MSQTSRMITATVPPISGSTPGIWDSAAVTPKLDIPVFSGVYIESVSGTGTTTEVDVTLYQGSDVRAELPKMNAKASYGTNVRQGSYASCNRFTLSNSTAAALIIEIRLNVDTYYVYNPPGTGGGGGVASHVVVDKTEGVTTVTGNVAVTGVNFPDKMDVDVKNTVPVTGTVGLNSGTTVAVTGVDFPTKMDVDIKNALPIPVNGNVGLISGTTVAVTGVTFPTKMNVDVKNDSPIPVSGTVAVSGVNFPTKMDVDIKNTAPVPVSGTVAVSGVNFPTRMDVDVKNTVPVSGTVAVSGVNFPTKMDVDVKDLPAITGTVGLVSDAAVAIKGTVAVSGVTFPTKMDVDVKDLPAITGTVDLIETAKVAIKGVTTVKLQSGTIDVNPTPAPSLSTAADVSVGTSTTGLVNARAKRVSLLMQAQITNTAPITIKAQDGTNICHLSPGGSMGVEYSGELQAISTADGQGIFVSEFYNP